MTSIKVMLSGFKFSAENKKNGMDFKQKTTKSYIKKYIYHI